MRADGYHLIDAEMVTLDLADELDVRPDGDGLEVVDEAGPGCRRPATTTSSRRALRARRPHGPRRG